MNLFKNFKIITPLFLIFLIFLFSINLNANEIKILAKVNNNIITNIDIKNEYNYLITLNTSLKEIEKRAAGESGANNKPNTPGDTPGGGFKTNKRKERRKKITIRIKNFTKKRK